QAPSSFASLACLMTSSLIENSVQKKIPTLAEIFQQNGFSTAAFLGNSFGSYSGLERGFNVFNANANPKRDASEVTAAASSWLRKHASERFFMWLHYQDPHAPYAPPAPFDTMFGAAGSGTTL